MSINTPLRPVLRFKMKPWWKSTWQKWSHIYWQVWWIGSLRYYFLLQGVRRIFFIFLPFHLFIVCHSILSPRVSGVTFSDTEISVTYGWLDHRFTLKWLEITRIEIKPISPANRNSYKAVFNGNRHNELILDRFVDPEVIVNQLKQKGKAYGFAVIDHRSFRYPTVALELDENFLVINHLDVSKTAISWEDIRQIEFFSRTDAGDDGEETGTMILIRGKRKDYRDVVDEVTEEQRGQMKLQGELLGFSVILGTGESDKRVG